MRHLWYIMHLITICNIKKDISYSFNIDFVLLLQALPLIYQILDLEQYHT